MLRRCAALFLITVALAACGGNSWFGKSAPPPLPGERQDILRKANQLLLNSALADVAVEINAAAATSLWPMQGGFPDHALGNLALNPDPLTLVWTADIGAGKSKDSYLLAQPVVADGVVYTLDADSELRAFALEDGRELWSLDLLPPGEKRDAIGSGGLALADGKIFVATGYASLVAVDIGSRKILWRQPVSSPLRTAPTVALGRVMVLPVDNRLSVLTIHDGLLAWSFDGAAEPAALLGGAAPAVSTKGIAIVPFNNGDLLAFDLATGRQLWNESLARIKRGDSMSALSTVQALPVIIGSRVFAIGHSDRTMALDLETGDRLWDVPVGGTQTPWLSNNFLFMLDNDHRLLALSLASGELKWQLALPHAEKGDVPYIYTGPVLAGGRLLVAGTDEKLRSIDAQTGQVTTSYELPDGVAIQPVLVSRTLLLLTQGGKLLAYR